MVDKEREEKEREKEGEVRWQEKTNYLRPEHS